MPRYPQINIEIAVDYGLTDIVAESFDAGVRLGEQVARDMVAVRIGPDFRMAVVAAPSYFKRRPTPKSPQGLAAHNCINIRLPTYGGLFPWKRYAFAAECLTAAELDGTLRCNRGLMRRSMSDAVSFDP